MKRTYGKRLVVLLFVIVFIIIVTALAMINIQHRLHDSSKPNIFEIPGTSREYEVSETIYCEYYFMVQKFPNSDSEIRKMIENFIDENSEIVFGVFEKGASHLCLNFMIPSVCFPVYFEENNNFFKMDDYVDHYQKTNLAVRVNFKSSGDDGEYIFYREIYQ